MAPAPKVHNPKKCYSRKWDWEAEVENDMEEEAEFQKSISVFN